STNSWLREIALIDATRSARVSTLQVTPPIFSLPLLLWRKLGPEHAEYGFDGGVEIHVIEVVPCFRRSHAKRLTQGFTIHRLACRLQIRTGVNGRLYLLPC